MSTRATIAVRRDDGSFVATYLHFDGYPEHAGKLLMANYQNTEQAETLIAGGDIRCLDTKMGEPEYFEDGRPPVELKTQSDLLDFVRDCGAQHVYLFANGAWEHKQL